MKHFLALATAAASLSFAVPADAAVYLFQLTGDYSATWTLDSSPAPDDTDGDSFTLWDVPGFDDAFLGIADLQFWTTSALGGFTITDFWGGATLLESTGPQLFSGSVGAPTFLLGTFELTELFGAGSYTLVISEASPGAIPEPATWGLMIAGFGLVGTALRRRHTQVHA